MRLDHVIKRINFVQFSLSQLVSMATLMLHFLPYAVFLAAFVLSCHGQERKVDKIIFSEKNGTIFAYLMNLTNENFILFG